MPIKVDIRRIGRYAKKHWLPLGALAVVIAMNHSNKQESELKGDFINSRGLNTEYWCYKNMQ